MDRSWLDLEHGSVVESREYAEQPLWTYSHMISVAGGETALSISKARQSHLGKYLYVKLCGL